MRRVKITDANASENREIWLALRRQHITATDWPRINGTSRYGCASDVLADKLVVHSEDEYVDSLPMRVGKGLEPLIVDKRIKRLGKGDYLSQVFISRKHMGFTPDLLQIKKGTDWALSEIKVSIRKWSGIVPPEVLDQVRYQATVLGIDQVQVVHLELSSWKEGLEMIRAGTLPGRRLAVYRVEVSEADRNRIERESERWWKVHILNGGPLV